MYDTIIIGSGPAGLSAAVYAKRANLNVAVIEKEYEGTGQIAESGNVNNYLGMPNMNGYDLGERFREHAVSLDVEFVEQEVTRIDIITGKDTSAKSYVITLDDEQKLETKSVIYAAGAYPRQANVPGEKEYIGKGVSYCAICDGAFYKDKTAAVLGGGDTALDDALYLSEICKKVYLIHRRSEFRGASSTVELLRKKENVEFVLEDSVTKINGEKTVTDVELASGKKMDVDGIFVAYGSIPQTSLIENLVKLDDRGYVVAGEDCAAYSKVNVTAADAEACDLLPGFFAAGDVRTKMLRQVVTAVADGANAATCVAEYLMHNVY